MEYHAFRIGTTFKCGEKVWKCTDIGSRVIVAVCLSDHKDDPSWYNGPPYAVAELVFDEDSIKACEPYSFSFIKNGKMKLFPKRKSP